MAPKPKVEKIYCLFHKKVDCNCIVPVQDLATLKLRIEHQKRLDELKNKYKLNL